MPLYTYKCVDCGETFDVRHSMSEKYTDCSSVGCTEKKQLVKILKPIVLRKKETEEQKVGSIVKQHIEEAKQEIKSEKERLQKEEYKPE
tara:strand:- start:1020 stop:1286 length:267 start_codon:yes stop_codon:yes gene_type:complete